MTSATRHRWPRAGRAALWLAAALGTILLLLAAAGLFLVTTESGARLAWRSAVQHVPGKLSGQLVGGTLDGGLALRNVVYADKGLRIAIDRLETRWELLRGPLALHVVYARAGRVDLSMAGGDRRPPVLPARLTLPLALRVDLVTLDLLALHRDEATGQIAGVRLHGGSTGVLHTLILDSATTAYGKASATLTLNGLPPFGVTGGALLAAAHAGQPYRVNAALEGTLAAPDLRLRVDGAQLDAEAQIVLAPFSARTLRSVQAHVRRLDPSRIRPQWPRADISAHISLGPAGTAAASGNAGLGGSVRLDNRQAGAFDHGLIPITGARATLAIGADRSVISLTEARLSGGARLTGSATLDQRGHGPLRLQVRELDLREIHTSLTATSLAGTLQAQLREKTQLAELALSQATLRIGAELRVTATAVELRKAQLSTGKSRLDLAGTLERGERRAFTASASLASFDPQAVWFALAPRGLRTAAKDVPAARVNADLRVAGHMAPQLAARLTFRLADSRYGGLPMRGAGSLTLAPAGRIGGDARIEIAGNVAKVSGWLGRPDDTLRFAIDAPSLHRLGYGVAGALDASGTIGGALRDLLIDARLTGRALAVGPYRAARINARARGLSLSQWRARQPVSLVLDGQGIRSANAAIGTASARIEGSYGKHTIAARIEGKVGGQPVRLTLRGHGGLGHGPQGPVWNGLIAAVDNATAPRIRLAAPVALTLAPRRIALGALRLRVAGATVKIDEFLLADARLRTAGSVSGLNLGHLLALREQFTGQRAPVSSDMLLDGRWTLAWSATDSEGMLRVQRVGGDVRTGAGVALGVDALTLEARLQDDRLALAATLGTRRDGSLAGEGQVLLRRAPGQLAPLPGSPVSGTLRAALPQLQSFAALAGPRIRISGSARAALTIGGTLADIRLGGSVTAQALGLTLFDYGLRLRDGSVRLTLADDIVRIDRAVFYGGNGTLVATGSFGLDGQAAGPGLLLVAQKLQVLGGPGGTLILSGTAGVERDGAATRIDGAVVVDSARMRFPDVAAPRLGDDVVVTRAGQVERAGPSPPWAGPAAQLGPWIVLRIGLGDDFRFTGGGADMLLAGQLTVRRTPAAPLSVNGTVRVVEGSYEAFGTELAIERGIINFQGPPDNPSVNIHAFRRGDEIETGVVVTGTVQQPRVQLVSEPDVSEAEKLSWLVFGRGGGGGAGQAGAAAQAAGIGLLNRFIGTPAASGLGLDEFGIGSSSLGAQGGQVINIGKEISDRLYLAYEQSITGGGGVLMLTYELSQFWSAVLYGGTVSGLELSYSRRFDRLGRKPAIQPPH
ncbi:translocation/assembly module TamB domain-containing protein [Massilia scottii]|uniref:translocation/assembly module TamB domain-containing protein n=1 Tax=Massilia scottii TaxID=3057166 RepID=UPI0027965332|nr:translocation/assembly module TamB domain-containing protein [Massilia sp. CCM 9029]MDQ1834156.1 translocation/assembly module TamB domain-containing protein [Massilia sp. CCM 9029]